MVQCCVCQKWRMYDLDLTDAISNNSTWQCSDNTDANRQSCMIDQDTVDHREHSILLAAVQENGFEYLPAPNKPMGIPKNPVANIPIIPTMHFPGKL